MIRDEDGQLSGYVYVDMAGRDIGGYVEEAKKKVAEQVTLPTGYTLSWSGQHEYMQRAQEKLIYVVPFTLLIIFLLLYINFKSVGRCVIVLLAFHRTPWGGASEDYRYIVPAVPIVALGFASAWQRWAAHEGGTRRGAALAMLVLMTCSAVLAWSSFLATRAG